MFYATMCCSRDILCESSVWLFSSRMPKSSRKDTRGHACGRPVHTHSGGGASIAASSVGVSTSRPVPPVQSSSFSGSSLLSAPVISSARATCLPAVVGDLLVTNLLCLICDEVRQSSLAGSSLPSAPLVAPPSATASTASASQQGPFAPGESFVSVSRTGGVCR